MICGMMNHGKDEPCATHGEDCRSRKPVQVCSRASTCGICGYCFEHCVGHLGVPIHLQIACGVPDCATPPADKASPFTSTGPNRRIAAL
jgi:hypothetical protein